MTSRSVSANVSQAPRFHVAPRAAKTYGDLAADFASDYGLTPDPWQQLVLDDWLAEKGGRWASLTCGLSVPRQNGKNALIEVRELFGMVGRGEKFLHTAHEVKTARKAFKRLQHFFGRERNDPAAKYPELNALVTEVRNVNGQEAIFLSNGGSVEIVARSKNSARGFTVDVLIMDEAQEMGEDDLEAMMPTTSSAPLGNPQWIFTGTPPGPSANGEIFTRVRSEALANAKRPNRLCWHEWSDEGSNLDDRDVWRRVNPALINGRLQFAVIEGERARFSDAGFARERLGRWDQAQQSHVFGAGRWEACKGPLPSGLEMSSLGLAVSIDAEHASLVGGAVADDRQVVKPLQSGPEPYSWLMSRAVEISRQHDVPVIVDGKGPAGAFIPQLVSELGPNMVRVVTFDEAKDACAGIHQAVQAGTLLHAGYKELDAAVASAVKRDVNDRWLWGRRKSTGDISPLEAATLAVWGLANFEPPAPSAYEARGVLTV